MSDVRPELEGEQQQHEVLELPPTEPIELPQWTPRGVDPELVDGRAGERRARDARIAALVHEAVDRGVPTTDVDLGLQLVPVHAVDAVVPVGPIRHARRRTRRAERAAAPIGSPALGLALLLVSSGLVGVLAGAAVTVGLLLP